VAPYEKRGGHHRCAHPEGHQDLQQKGQVLPVIRNRIHRFPVLIPDEIVADATGKQTNAIPPLV
jgi:hypothetical protein